MKDLETLFNVLLAAIEERVIPKTESGLIYEQAQCCAGTLGDWKVHLAFRAAYSNRTPPSYYSVALWLNDVPAVFQSGSVFEFAATSGQLWELVSKAATEMIAADPSGVLARFARMVP